MKLSKSNLQKMQNAGFVLTIVSALLISLFICNSQASAEDVNKTNLKSMEEEQNKAMKPDELDEEAQALEKVQGPISNKQVGKVSKNRAELIAAKSLRPKNATKGAAAESQAGQSQVGNSAGDIARDMACMAIDYASRFMKNFTTSDGNRWNRHRNNVFVPIALLLILPGAVLTQVRAIMAQGNPVLGATSPLEGIQRGIIAVALVPASCLVTNFAIDLGNSLHYTVSSEYSRIVGGDMYRDAMCAEIRAFGVRYLAEAEGSLSKDISPDLSPRGNEPFAKIEGRLWGKISDPCTGLYLVPPNREDTIMPQASIATRMGMYTANAGLCAGWALLTAFQMAFFYYLYFAGPIMAGLWAWPTQMFKQAFPTWVESCITLAFWSFLWQITICLLAMTKAQASTGLYMVTALNVLATTSVKHAFDCAAIMKSAVQQCEMIGAEVAAGAESGGGGGGKGGGKGGKKGGAKGAGSKQNSAPAAAPDKVASSAPIAARMAGFTVTHDDEGNELPKVPAAPLKANAKGPMPLVSPQNVSKPPLAAPVAPVVPVVPATPAESIGPTAPRVAFSDPMTGWSPDVPETPVETKCTLNKETGVWNDPVCAAPPSSGHPVAPLPRNTIGSVLGNSIQNVMHYPASVPHKDPDLIYLEEVKAEIEELETQDQEQTQSAEQNADQLEGQRQQVADEQTQLAHGQDFSPSTPNQESEMNSNDDPRIAALRDQRFNYPPPPMVSGQPAAGFAKVPSGVALTPQQLLSKLQTVAEAAAASAPPVSAPPLTGFSLVPNTQQSFEPQEEVLVTVADFTSDLQGQSAPESRKPNLNHALGTVLRQRGAWAQAETPIKPPVPQALSNSWWS